MIIFPTCSWQNSRLSRFLASRSETARYSVEGSERISARKINSHRKMTNVFRVLHGGTRRKSRSENSTPLSRAMLISFSEISHNRLAKPGTLLLQVIVIFLYNRQLTDIALAYLYLADSSSPVKIKKISARGEARRADGGRLAKTVQINRIMEASRSLMIYARQCAGNWQRGRHADRSGADSRPLARAISRCACPPIN